MLDPTLSLQLSLDRLALAADQRGSLDLLVEVRARAEPGVARAPLAVALALDVSPSMGGSPIAQVLESTRRIVELARPDDELAIVTFAEDAQVLVPLARMTRAHAEACRRALSRVALRNATNIGAGLELAARALRSSARGSVASVLLLSDGAPNVGPRTPAELGRLAAEVRRQCSVTTLGFGAHHDDHVLGAVAECGGGSYRFIHDPATCSLELMQAFGAQADVVARDVVLDVLPAEGVRVRAVSPRDERPGRSRLPDLAAGEGRLVLVELEVDPRPLDAGTPVVRVELSSLPAGASVREVVRAEAHVAVAHEASSRLAHVVRRGLQVSAAEARVEARQRADAGDFAGAAHVVGAMIQRIQAHEGVVEDQALQDALDQLLDDAALYGKRPDRESYAAFRRGQRGDLASADARAGQRAPQSDQAREVQLALAGITHDAVFERADGSVVPLPLDGMIGRSKTCDIVVASSQVSRQHAHVFALQGDFWVSDMGSANSVYINGRRTPEPYRLRHGDQVMLGDTVLRFVVR